jgi:hypothetical protein
MSESRQPWDRLEAETGPAWHAFTLYRDLPAGERSLSRVASELVAGDPTATPPKPQRKGKVENVRTELARWSSRHEWVDRCAAYDRDADRRHLEAHREEAKAMNERHLAHAQACFEVIAMPIRAMQQRMLTPGFFDDMTDGEALAFVDKMLRHSVAIAEFERRSRGLTAGEQPGGISTPQIDVTGPWLADVFDALIEAGIEPPAAALRALPGPKPADDDPGDDDDGDDAA